MFNGTKSLLLNIAKYKRSVGDKKNPLESRKNQQSNQKHSLDINSQRSATELLGASMLLICLTIHVLQGSSQLKVFAEHWIKTCDSWLEINEFEVGFA